MYYLAMIGGQCLIIIGAIGYLASSIWHPRRMGPLEREPVTDRKRFFFVLIVIGTLVAGAGLVGEMLELGDPLMELRPIRPPGIP